MNIDIVYDAQYGSTGKGLICGYLGANNSYQWSIGANAPNAGHTFIDEYGNKFVHKVLPNSVIYTGQCLIGPGAIIDLKQLSKEVNNIINAGFSTPAIYIHENAMVLNDVHVRMENDYLKQDRGSTKQGVLGAMIDKLSRQGGSRISDLGLDSEHFQLVNHKDYTNIIMCDDKALAEGAQGFSLGIDQGFYPYTTTRNCTPDALAQAMGFPTWMIEERIASYRTYPIRVGGDSGPWYDDQEEIAWEELGQKPETTTVTGRVRRVATFSMNQMRDSDRWCRPTKRFLNFCNYGIPRCLVKDREKFEYCGWGPTVNDVDAR